MTGTRPLKTLINIVAIVLFGSFLAVHATALASASESKSLNAGSTWMVKETIRLSSLTITGDAAIEVPDGYSLTMTVAGVETPVAPGVYSGEIVLTPTLNIPVFYSGSGIEETYNLRTGIYIDSGSYVPEKSVASAVVGGTVTDDAAKDVSITSAGESFNGIIAAGDSEYKYSVVDSEIRMTGNGGNDFAGYGAAVTSDGKAQLVVENTKILNKGCIRGAVYVGGDSTAWINNSDIEVQNGTLPEVFKVPEFMMEVPWMLGLKGNNRATLVVDNGTAYYTDSHIKAQGWGVLSTDAVQRGVKLYATRCRIETVESGYGAYADGNSVDTFSDCSFDVNDYALIMTGGSGVFTDGTVVESDRFGVMMHSLGSGTLTIDKGSVFNTGGPVIQVKTAFPTIKVDSSELNSRSGVILLAMVNDDLNATGGPGGMAVAGDTGRDDSRGGMPPGGAGGGMSPGGGGSMPPGGAEGGMPPGGGEGGMSPGGGAGGPGGSGSAGGNVTATFSNMTLAGDIVTSMTSLGDVLVTLDKVDMTGAITTATCKTVAEIEGVSLSKETYQYIGEVVNTYAATDDEYGVKASLTGNSIWTVDKTSYLTGLTLGEGAVISAPKGYRVDMTVDGVATAITAGDYEGSIVLTVSK